MLLASLCLLSGCLCWRRAARQPPFLLLTFSVPSPLPAGVCRKVAVRSRQPLRHCLRQLNSARRILLVCLPVERAALFCRAFVGGEKQKARSKKRRSAFCATSTSGAANKQTNKRAISEALINFKTTNVARRWRRREAPETASWLAFHCLAIVSLGAPVCSRIAERVATDGAVTLADCSRLGGEFSLGS